MCNYRTDYVRFPTILTSDLARVIATLNLLGLLRNPRHEVLSNSLCLTVDLTVDTLISLKLFNNPYLNIRHIPCFKYFLDFEDLLAVRCCNPNVCLIKLCIFKYLISYTTYSIFCHLLKRKKQNILSQEYHKSLILPY